MRFLSNIFESIGNIFNGLFLLIYGLASLLVNIWVGVCVVVMVYLMIIRPIWGSIFDKGKRLYWFSLIVLLVFSFVVGPFMVIKLSDRYGTKGIIIGGLLFLLGIWLISRVGKKQENTNNQKKIRKKNSTGWNFNKDMSSWKKRL